MHGPGSLAGLFEQQPQLLQNRDLDFLGKLPGQGALKQLDGRSGVAGLVAHLRQAQQALLRRKGVLGLLEGLGGLLKAAQLLQAHGEAVQGGLLPASPGGPVECRGGGLEITGQSQGIGRAQGEPVTLGLVRRRPGQVFQHPGGLGRAPGQEEGAGLEFAGSGGGFGRFSLPGVFHGLGRGLEPDGVPGQGPQRRGPVRRGLQALQQALPGPLQISLRFQNRGPEFQHPGPVPGGGGGFQGRGEKGAGLGRAPQGQQGLGAQERGHGGSRGVPEGSQGGQGLGGLPLAQGDPGQSGPGLEGLVFVQAPGFEQPGVIRSGQGVAAQPGEQPGPGQTHTDKVGLYGQRGLGLGQGLVGAAVFGQELHELLQHLEVPWRQGQIVPVFLEGLLASALGQQAVGLVQMGKGAQPRELPREPVALPGHGVRHGLLLGGRDARNGQRQERRQDRSGQAGAAFAARRGRTEPDRPCGGEGAVQHRSGLPPATTVVMSLALTPMSARMSPRKRACSAWTRRASSN